MPKITKIEVQKIIKNDLISFLMKHLKWELI